jgi:hypothetical protein
MSRIPSQGFHTPRKGVLKLRRPLQRDGMGQHLSGFSVPIPVSHSSYDGAGGRLTYPHQAPCVKA